MEHPAKRTAPPAPRPSVTLETDGRWCPMAHANRNDNSTQELPPLRRVATATPIQPPGVSPGARFNLGSFTGETMAVCASPAPDGPALVAYDYRDLSVRWTSPLRDLPGRTSRHLAHILMAKLATDGGPARRCVFAANPAEFVAYTADGARLWKRASREVTPRAPNGVGGPISLSFTDRHELVAATTDGWVVKLDPTDGRTVDAYRMDASVFLAGALRPGTFLSRKSIAVVGNVLYLAAEFAAHARRLRHPLLRPVYLLRIELTQPGGAGRAATIRPLGQVERASEPPPDRIRIGVARAGGSPCAWVSPSGGVRIAANADVVRRGHRAPVLAWVEDDRGELRLRWRSVLTTIPGDLIHAAPAFDERSETLLVTTTEGIQVFRDADTLAGEVPPPKPLPVGDLITVGRHAAKVGVGSPLTLVHDPDNEEIVTYTNFRVRPRRSRRTYGFLGAFAVPATRPGPPTPLWCRPLAVTATGRPAPGAGTMGQPALFRYDGDDGPKTGLIVSTFSSGTQVFR